MSTWNWTDEALDAMRQEMDPLADMLGAIAAEGLQPSKESLAAHYAAKRAGREPAEPVAASRG